MYTLTIEYNTKGIGETQWLFTEANGAEAFGLFFNQVTAFMRYDRVHIKLVKGENIIAEYKINSIDETRV